jgi:hypothetical protein
LLLCLNLDFGARVVTPLTPELTLGGVIGEPATRGLLDQGNTIGREHELRQAEAVAPPPTCTGQS